MQGSRIVNRGLAAGALFGMIVGIVMGWIGRDFTFWVPTAIAIGIGVGLVIEVRRGPQL